MTEQELFSKLQTLRQIKPRENWVTFTRNQILVNSIVKDNLVHTPTYKGLFLNSFSSLFQRKLAYALAGFLFIVGVLGFISLPNKQVALKDASPAALVEIKSNVETLKTKSQNLAKADNNKSGDITLQIKEANDAAKELTKAIEKDPQLVKEVALDVNNNKTYLNVVGENDLKETSDTLYKIIDSQMIEDLDKTTLTEDQQKTLDMVKDLYDQGKYSSALENALLLMNSRKK